MTVEDLAGQASCLEQRVAEQYRVCPDAKKRCMKITCDMNRGDKHAVNTHAHHHEEGLEGKGEESPQVIGSDLSPFPVGQGGKGDRRDRNIQIYLDHAPVAGHCDHDGHELHAETHDQALKGQYDEGAQLHVHHRCLRLGNQRRHINGSVAAEHTRGCVYHVLPDIKHRHCHVECVAEQVDRDPHLEDIFEKHPRINVMHVVFLGQHGDQLIAHDEGDDHPCDRQNHRVGQVPDHIENTSVPPLRRLSNLRGDLTRPGIDVGEHGLQVGLHHGCQKGPHPHFDRFKYRIEHGLSSPFSSEQSGQLGDKLCPDQDDTAAGHQLLDSLALRARIVIPISFQEVDHAPYTQSGANGRDQGLEDGNRTAEKSHIKT